MIRRNMGKQKPKNDGSLPNVVVNQILEHTVGGFILFYFNNETGQPDQVMSFDSPAHCLALQKYIEDWDAALQQASHNNAVQNIERNIREMNDGGENNEEE